MKAIYFYDPQTMLFTKVDLISDDAELPANCTEIEPINENGTGMYDPRWDGAKWISMTVEDYEEKHKNDLKPDEEKHDPTPQEQAITGLAQQIADQNKHVESLEQAITELAKGGQ